MELQRVDCGGNSLTSRSLFHSYSKPKYRLNLRRSRFGKQVSQEEVEFAMAAGKKSGYSLNSKRRVVADEAMNLGLVRHTRDLGRKRVAIPCDEDASRIDSSSQNQSKKQCADRKAEESEKCPLESLPQDVLIRVLCGVDHDDLKNLLVVSKSIKEATLIAKKSHFAYTTPKKIRAFRTEIQFEYSNELDEIEPPPNVPKRKFKTRLFGKELGSISMALFPSMDEDWWARKPLFME